MNRVTQQSVSNKCLISVRLVCLRTAVCYAERFVSSRCAGVIVVSALRLESSDALVEIGAITGIKRDRSWFSQERPFPGRSARYSLVAECREVFLFFYMFPMPMGVLRVKKKKS